jgi:hypothetical protein
VPEINEFGQTVNDIVPSWNGAGVLPRTALVGRFSRLVPLDAARHAVDLFEAYALGDGSDWTWMASNAPETIAATTHWLMGKVMDDALVPYAVIDARTEQAVGLVCYMAIERQMGSVEIGHVTWSRKMRNSPSSACCSGRPISPARRSCSRWWMWRLPARCLLSAAAPGGSTVNPLRPRR